MEKESKIYRILSKVYLISFVLILTGFYIHNFFINYYDCYDDLNDDYFICHYNLDLSLFVDIFGFVIVLIFIIYSVLLSPIIFFFSIKSLRKEIKSENLSWKKLFINLSFYNLLITSACIFYILLKIIFSFINL